MSRDNGPGIFDMEFITHVSTLSDVTAGKTAAFERIEASEANDANKAKAKAMISRASTMSKLLQGMTNFSLAHQGLKVI